jgi:hypothetical protein
MRKTVLLFALVIYTSTVFSQNLNLNCKVYDTNTSKIPDMVIKTLAMDNKDQVWFATGDCFFGGKLVMFNGYDFTIFD